MYDYMLPDVTGKVINKKCENNSLIIIGANGAGKSKLGAWIEKHDMEKVHRVSAQRKLSFNEYIPLKTFEQATNILIYGQAKKDPAKNLRWGGYGNSAKLTATLIDDYECILSALFAKENIQYKEFVSRYNEQNNKGIPFNEVSVTVIDDFQRIWNDIFPQRQIKFDDGKVTTMFKVNGVEHSYKGNEMSDGERVALYLIAQCLCIPKNKTIIIDEPEIHLLRSIMNKLWSAIEKQREDCLFIYITHDTQFAANHSQAEKIWVKSYDGKDHWELEMVENSTLPE